MLLVGRFVIGLGIGIANIACSTYVAESGEVSHDFEYNYKVSQLSGQCLPQLSTTVIGSAQ